MLETSYDHIIIGAGSPGRLVANRLSEDPCKTVLLEEGGRDDTSPLISMPRGVGKLLTPGNALDY